MRGIVFGLVFIGLVLLADKIWPTRQDVISTGSIALLLFVMGIFALVKPQQFIKYVEATDYVRVHVYQKPLRTQIMGFIFLGAAILVFYQFVSPKL